MAVSSWMGGQRAATADRRGAGPQGSRKRIAMITFCDITAGRSARLQ